MQIENLANPGADYLSTIVANGEVTVFIEGASHFGNFPAHHNQLGGALLKWEFSDGTSTCTEKLLVYRGGFLRFLQPRNTPSVAGTFEFRDGKGRVRQTNGGYQREFDVDDTDLGNVLLSWSAKSGKTVPTGSTDYRLANRSGHTPPGWWSTEENPLANTELQNSEVTNRGQANETWMQSGICRWLQDDAPAAGRYSEDWEYHADNAHDAAIGRPTAIECKFRLTAIPPTTTYTRGGLLIHPDGERNGTLGCIGVQTISNAKK